MMNVSGAPGHVSSSANRNDSEEKAESTQILMTQIYTLSSEAKIEGVLEFVNELEGYEMNNLLLENPILYDEMKLIIFAFHQTMLDALHEEAKKKKIGAIRIDGKTPAEERGIMVQNFQTNPTIRWAILSITAASVGLTLTASNVVIFAELYWTPAIIFQAEDRAHRISQTSAVTCYYLLAKDTIDQAMFDMIQKKSNLTNQLLDGGEADELTFTNAAHPSRASKPLTIMDHFGSKANHQLLWFVDSSERFSLSKENLEELEELESQVLANTQGSSSQSKRPTEIPTVLETEGTDTQTLTKPVQTRTLSVNHHKVDAIEPEQSQREKLGSPWSANNQPDASWAEDPDESQST